MKFYIRKPGTSDFQLLSSFEELRTQLQAGTITTEYEVLEATGQTYGALKRSTDWMRIGKRWYTAGGEVGIRIRGSHTWEGASGHAA